jgi:cyanophycin synthetase
MKAGQTDLGRISRIGVVATAGDRREEDMRELGSIAAEHFDVVVVREDERLRGRERGFTAEQVAQGVRSRIGEPGVRCRQVEIVLDETAAVRHVMARANPGDIVVLSVDEHAAVMSELEEMTKQAQPGTHTQHSVGDPDLDPVALTVEATETGDVAARDVDAAEVPSPAG